MAEGFGAGIGQFIGGALGAHDLGEGLKNINGTAEGFGGTVAPYDAFGQSFMPAASDVAGKVAGSAGTTQSYDDFAKNYTASPGVKYQTDQALEAQNESAASKGGLLSGTNQRALSGISTGMAATGLNNAYNEYLQGNNQQFSQLTQALGSLFQGIGVGTTATGQQAGVASSQIAGQSAIAQAQAKNDQSKGSGIGSMFGGIGALAAAF